MKRFLRHKDEAQFFRYRPGNTFLHRAPGLLKVLLMIALGILAFYVPPVPAALSWAFLVAFSLVFLHFTPAEVLTDSLPALLYGAMLYLAGIALSATELTPETEHKILFLLKPHSAYVELFMHLTLSLEVTAVFYRTTSRVQLSSAFESIERLVTRGHGTPVSDALTLTIMFIPRLAAVWFTAEKAWRSRGGKNGVKKILVLIPVLFKSGMGTAYTTALARANRL